MKFVLAPDKYKSSLTGTEFCVIVGKVLNTRYPNAEVVELPLADGGDGTIEVVQQYLDAQRIQHTVNDPLFRPIQATYLFSEAKKAAFIEMAEASGYRLLRPEERNAVNTTTYGTGELIADAIAKGAQHVFLGIGGSATNDGGMGMAQALGYTFKDKDANYLRPIGKHLSEAVEILPPTSKTIKAVDFKVACDVDNPFYGASGAAKVYARQKGASEKEIEQLDVGLKHFAKVVKKQFGIDLQEIPGSGAAGGLGGGAVAFLNAQLVSGIELVKEIADFETKIDGADWIITGEGRLDDQTLSGKTIGGVLQAAKKQQIQVAALCGKVDLSVAEQQKMGLAYTASISDGMPNLEIALQKTAENLEQAAFEFVQSLK